MSYIPSIYTIIKESTQIAKELHAEKLMAEAKGTHQIRLEWPIVSRLTEKFKNHLKGIGKKETIPIRKIIELNNNGQMPTMIKHCVVAVRKDLKSEGLHNSFFGAHNICFWSFIRYRLTNRNYQVSGSGTLREKYHKSKADPNAGAKTAMYNKIFNTIFKVKA